MAKKCIYCNNQMGDNDPYCPVCGKPAYNGNQTPNAQPGMYPAQNPAPPAPQKEKSNIPYILAGIGLAAVIFGVLLFVILGIDKNPAPKPSDESSSSHASIAETEKPTEEPTDEPTEEPTEDTGIAGSYKLIEVSGSDELESMKDSITLDVDSDGSAVMTASTTGNTIAMVFDVDKGTAEMQGETVNFTFDGKLLTLEDSTGKMVFEKI